jgi:hypothetical protein
MRVFDLRPAVEMNRLRAARLTLPALLTSRREDQAATL